MSTLTYVAGIAVLGALTLLISSTSFLRKTRERAAEQERIRRHAESARRALALREKLEALRRKK